MAGTDRLPATTAHTRWRSEGAAVALWLAAGLAAQVASYRAIEGASTGRDRLVIAAGVAVAVVATTLVVAGALTRWWRPGPDSTPRRRLLVVAFVVTVQTAWHVVELADRAARRTDDPAWVALPLLHIATAALSGVAVLTGVRLVLARAGGGLRSAPPRRRRDAVAR